jgi:hypothetical protein
MNSTSQQLRLAATKRVPAQLKAATVRTLLLTAATRHCSASIKALVSFPAVRQHVDASLLEELLSYLPADCGSVECMILERVPAARHVLFEQVPAAAAALSNQAVVKLLVVALHWDCDKCASKVCSMPAAQELGTEEVARLLAMGAKQKSRRSRINGGTTTAELCSLPAAQQIEVGTLEQLLQTAVQHDNNLVVEELCCLSACQQLGSTAVARLLRASIEVCSDECMKHLCAIPAALQLGCAAVEELLQVALTGAANASKHTCLEHLCSLPAAQQLNGKATTTILAAYVQKNNFKGVKVLCSMPGAQQLSGEAVLQLLLAALAQDNDKMASQLCRMPAAERLSAEVVVPLLEAAVEEQQMQRLGFLSDIPAARQLSASMFARLLMFAALGCHSCPMHVVVLDTLSPDVLSSGVIVRLLRVAVARGRHRFVNYVCGLPAARELESAMVGPLLQDAEKRGFVNCAQPLRNLLSSKNGLGSSDATEAMDGDALYDRIVNSFGFGALCS